MEKEKKYKGKGKAFLSKNIYYVIMVVCVLIIGAMITVVALSTRKDNDVTQPTVQTPDNTQTTTDKEPGTTPVDTEPEQTDTTPKTTVYILPVEDSTVGLDYSVDALVFYASLNNWQVHKGIDFVTAEPSDVKAVLDGTVESVSTDALNGTVVVLKHADGYKSVYKSLSDATVKQGDKVKQGDVIGKTSATMATEASMGNHVHFELEKDSKVVDPNLYLPTVDK